MNPTPFNYSEAMPGLMTPTPPPVGTPFLDMSFDGQRIAADAVGTWNIVIMPFWDMIGFVMLLFLVLAGIYAIVAIMRQL